MLKTLINLFALGQIFAHVSSSRDVEVIGLLMGHDEGSDLVINGVLPLVEKGSSVGVVVKDYLSLVDRVKEWQNIFGSKEIFRGWYHSHPGHGIFLSEIDLDSFAAQQEYYGNLVFLVVDPYLPIGNSFKVFFIESNKKYREIPSELILPKDMDSLVFNTREVRKMLEDLNKNLTTKISKVEELIKSANLEASQRLSKQFKEDLNILEKNLSGIVDRQKTLVVDALNQFDIQIDKLRARVGELQQLEKSHFDEMKNLLMRGFSKLNYIESMLNNQEDKLSRVEQILDVVKQNLQGPKKIDKSSVKKSIFE
ncbi:MAG: hypothetical protein QXR19_16035 [Candidatus Jordarchaeaceae archaeon]